MIKLMKDNIRRIVPEEDAGEWLRRGFINCRKGEGELPPSPDLRAYLSTLTVMQLKELLKARGIPFRVRERKAQLMEKYQNSKGGVL